MAVGNVRLTFGNNNFSAPESYTETIEYLKDVDNTDAGVALITIDGSNNSPGYFTNFKSACIYNMSKTGVELIIKTTEYKNDSNTDIQNSVDLGPGATVNRYTSIMLAGNDFFYFPTSRIVGYNAAESAANAVTIDNVAPNSNMYVDSGADTTEGFADDDDTTITFDNGSGGVAYQMFKEGDLIRLDDEICRITSIVDTAGDGAYTPAHFIVDRAVYGSTKADHTNNTDIRFPFFNTNNRFNKYSVCQTNEEGNFHARNFFGYGRTMTGIYDGIVPGSIAVKFYQPGYQSMGLTGITSSTNTGLTASETYYLTVAVDGGSAVEINVTIDATNTNFGGKNGLIQKLQQAINAKYFVSGGLFEKRMTVKLVNGDVRFISGQFLSTSAVALTAGTSGAGASVRLLAQQNGRIPILAGIQGAVAAKLPLDTVRDSKTYEEVKNVQGFMTDNGRGILSGIGNGRINYETGEIDFTAFPNSEFVITATYNSVQCGGIDTSTNGFNTITSVSGRSMNSKMDAKLKVIVYN